VREERIRWSKEKAAFPLGECNNPKRTLDPSPFLSLWLNKFHSRSGKEKTEEEG